MVDMIFDCFYLIFVLVLFLRCFFIIIEVVMEEIGLEKYIIKDCNGI